MAIDIADTTAARWPTTPAGTGERVAATITTRRNERWFEVALLGGLAGVFIVNAVVAWLQPSDFVDLVHSQHAVESGTIRDRSMAGVGYRAERPRARGPARQGDPPPTGSGELMMASSVSGSSPSRW